MKHILFLCCILLSAVAQAATSIPFTINMSEAVNVTGTPRVAVDVGGVTRYATYTSGTGTSALTFTYTMTAGDVDLDGVTLTSPLQLNGGTIKDLNGNDATLTFSIPNTSNVKVNYPSLGMDFVYDADGRYTLNGTAYNDLSSFLTATGGSFTRASIGTYYDSSGVLQTATSNTPRFDYDPVTHTPKGILIEESRTNVLLRSSEFDISWNVQFASINPDTMTAPDGTNSADKLVDNNIDIYHQTFQTISVTNGTTYTFSIFAKAAEKPLLILQGQFNGARGAVGFDLSNGTVGSQINGGTGTILPVGNGWYRCTMTFTADNTGIGNIYARIAEQITPSIDESYLGNGTNGLYLWGGQFEVGAFPTSYIPTTTAAVTRATDSFSIGNSGVSSFYNASESSVFGQFDYHATTSVPAGVFVMSDGTPANRFGHASGLTGNRTDGFVVSSGVQTGILNSLIASTTAFTPHKFALGIMQNNFAGSGDGGGVVTDNSGAIPTGINNLDFGFFYPTIPSSNYLNGHIANFKYYPVRIPDTQLQLMTQ